MMLSNWKCTQCVFQANNNSGNCVLCYASIICENSYKHIYVCKNFCLLESRFVFVNGMPVSTLHRSHTVIVCCHGKSYNSIQKRKAKETIELRGKLVKETKLKLERRCWQKCAFQAFCLLQIMQHLACIFRYNDVTTCTSTDTDKNNLRVRTNVENNKQSNERTKKYLLSSNTAAAAALATTTTTKKPKEKRVFFYVRKEARYIIYCH